MEKKEGRGTRRFGGGWQWQLYKQGEGERGEGEDHAHVWLGKCVGVAKGKADHGRCGAGGWLPGWGLLGVEVEVVGKQDSLAAAVPRGIGICMRCSVWTGSGGSWGQEAKSNGSFFFFANNQMGGQGS